MLLTDRQTSATENITSFAKEVKICFNSDFYSLIPSLDIFFPAIRIETGQAYHKVIKGFAINEQILMPDVVAIDTLHFLIHVP